MRVPSKRAHPQAYRATERRPRARFRDMGEIRRRRVRHWYWLLVPPFVGTLWVPFYNSIEPTLFGIPFFFWYQFLWIGIGAALTAFVYFVTRNES